MHYLVFLLLFVGGFCGGKVIRREESNGRGSGISLLPDLPTLHEAPAGPVGGYEEYYRSGSSFPPMTPALASLWRNRSGRRGERGRRHDDRGGRRGHVRIGRGRRILSVSGYNPRKYHSIYDNGYYPKPRVYYNPLQYVGFPEFFVSGKRKKPSEEAKAAAAAAAKEAAIAKARNFDSPWKAFETAMNGIPPWESAEGSDKPRTFAMTSIKRPGEKLKVVRSWDTS